MCQKRQQRIDASRTLLSSHKAVSSARHSPLLNVLLIVLAVALPAESQEVKAIKSESLHLPDENLTSNCLRDVAASI